LIERETPRPGPGEVVLAVLGSCLFHSDVGRMDGTLTPYMPKKPPIILGHEVAGVVIEVGEGVCDHAAGDRVVASGTVEFCPGRNADGGYAKHCLLPAHCLIRLPDTVSFVQGAAATDAGQTSHSALMVAGELRAGQRVGIVGLGGLNAGPTREELDDPSEDVHTIAEVLTAEAVRLLREGRASDAAKVLVRADQRIREKGLRQEYVAPVLPWLATALSRAKVKALHTLLPTVVRTKREPARMNRVRKWRIRIEVAPPGG
jgi:hypothetical protein